LAVLTSLAIAISYVGVGFSDIQVPIFTIWYLPTFNAFLAGFMISYATKSSMFILVQKIGRKDSDDSGDWGTLYEDF